MPDTLIKVQNVSKKFCRDLKRSLWYGMRDLGRELACRSGKGVKPLRKDEFWAINDISFELKRGECLGLIGRNGAGKTTLLRMLNGLIKPDQGRIEMRGLVGALISLGAGFNPILTGRENIYVNGMLLGFSKQEIESRLKSIIEFSELEEFIEVPIQNYSSGMQVRLGFAIASQMDPDVLILDEILAVGDVGFRAKCFNTINSLIQKAAVIFVSHSMPQISRICSDILVLDKGKSIFHGKDIPKGIDQYYANFDVDKFQIAGSGKAVIHKIELENDGTRSTDAIYYMNDFVVHIDCTIDKSIENPNISVVISNQELQSVAQCSSYMNGVNINNAGQRLLISLYLGKINLNPGIYFIGITITAENRGEVLGKYQNVTSFRLKGKHSGFAPVQMLGDWKVVSNQQDNSS